MRAVSKGFPFKKALFHEHFFIKGDFYNGRF
uniref:Uncharacterized protein n=1 Tax=Siphoviridae sp. ctKcB20 TaxID=2827568 RepID=A0A8S5LLL2_9CAUD|nr:MAG TPA: hypothetical protein [Siphoviridae sp. ctKcB20]